MDRQLRADRSLPRSNGQMYFERRRQHFTAMGAAASVAAVRQGLLRLNPLIEPLPTPPKTPQGLPDLTPLPRETPAAVSGADSRTMFVIEEAANHVAVR